MAATTTLIAKADFEPYTDIAQYLRDEYIDRELIAVQNSYLPALLGPALYETLQTEKEGATLTANNTTLIEKLTPFLVYQSSYEYAKTDFAQANESGYRVRNNANDRPIDSDERNAILTKYKERAVAARRSFEAWLSDNEDTYPTLDKTDLKSSTLGLYKASGKARQNRISETGTERQWI